MAIVQLFEDRLASSTRLSLIAAGSAIAIALYWALLAFYRLYWSPLAKIPGPKLAALTRWTETYYEIGHGEGGQFIWQYRKWHEQYGPIVRISPDEVHIQDSDFFHTLYSSSQKLDKLKRLENRFSSPKASFATPKHETHRIRRAALNPFFSTRKIALHSPVIQNRVNKLCDRLQREYANSNRFLVMDDMWGCLTSDTIVEYCFDRAYHFTELPDFRAFFLDAMNGLANSVHLVTQFPWILSIVNSLPDWMVMILQPDTASVITFNNEMSSQISAILSNRKVDNAEKSSKTVFASLLDSDLQPEELSLTRLQHEAISLIGAGIETTKRALSVASFHILDNPAILARLREELISAIPNPESLPPLEVYEKLPYLSACIEEALRLSYGTAQRTPRTSETQTIMYKSYALPPGTVISMSNFSVSHDENIFPDSFTFRPERWLDAPKAPDGKYLSRYMVSFGKGTRTCLGMKLAYAEIYIALATVFRRCDFELFETTRDAVDCYRDRFVPSPKPGTLGVRVLVK